MHRRSSSSDLPLISWVGSAAFCHLLAGIVLRALAPATAAATPKELALGTVDIEVLPNAPPTKHPSARTEPNVGTAPVVRAAPAVAATTPAALLGRSARGGAPPESGAPNGVAGHANDDDAPVQQGMGSAPAVDDERGTTQVGMASPRSHGGHEGAVPPRGLTGDHDYPSSTRTDVINRCVRARGGQVSVTLSNGDLCTYSAKRGGWASACSDPNEASLALGRSCN